MNAHRTKEGTQLTTEMVPPIPTSANPFLTINSMLHDNLPFDPAHRLFTGLFHLHSTVLSSTAKQRNRVSCPPKDERHSNRNEDCVRYNLVNEIEIDCAKTKREIRLQFEWKWRILDHTNLTNSNRISTGDWFQRNSTVKTSECSNVNQLSGLTNFCKKCSKNQWETVEITGAVLVRVRFDPNWNPNRNLKKKTFTKPLTWTLTQLELELTLFPRNLPKRRPERTFEPNCLREYLNLSTNPNIFNNKYNNKFINIYLINIRNLMLPVNWRTALLLKHNLYPYCSQNIKPNIYNYKYKNIVLYLLYNK